LAIDSLKRKNPSLAEWLKNSAEIPEAEKVNLDDPGEILVNAAEAEDVRTIRRLYLQGVSVDQEDSNGRVALRTAAKAGHVNLVRQLLTDFGADVNAKNRHNNETALHYASKFNREETIKVLVEYGADNSMLSKNKLKASGILKQKNPQLAKWLESVGSRSKTPRQTTYSADQFISATAAGDAAALRTMIRQGMQVDTLDPDGRCAIRTAAKFGHTNVIRMLLVEFRADVNLRNPYNHQTALHFACKYNKEEAIKVLVEHGADRTLRDKENVLAADLLQKKNPQLADWIRNHGN